MDQRRLPLRHAARRIEKIGAGDENERHDDGQEEDNLPGTWRVIGRSQARSL